MRRGLAMSTSRGREPRGADSTHCDAGLRHYGAVAHVNATNADLSLRLANDDVQHLTDPRLKFRDVQPGNAYQINCSVIYTPLN